MHLSIINKNDQIYKQIEELFKKWELFYEDYYISEFPSSNQRFLRYCEQPIACKKFELIKEEDLIPEDKKLYEDLKFYFIVKFDHLLSSIEAKIFKYLENNLLIEQLQITRENASLYLRKVKIIDLAIAWKGKHYHSQIKICRTTYKIRQRILETCSPEMTTCEAFTKTLNPLKFTDPEYLKKPCNWVARRVGHQAKAVIVEFVKAIDHSQKLNGQIKAWRGNTCAGKSSQEVGLNVDNFKKLLKKPFLTNTQVHQECSAIFYYNFRKEIAERPTYKFSFLSYILDSRLITLEELEECILKPARIRNCPISIVDFDVPLETSLNRNLILRNPYGPAPCVSTEVVVSGFVRLRENRAKIIDHVKKEKLVTSYKLFLTNEYGEKNLIFEKNNEKTTIYFGKHFQESQRIPSQEEIFKIRTQIITSEYIDKSIVRGDVPVDRKIHFQKWLGTSLEKAVDTHSKGK